MTTEEGFVKTRTAPRVTREGRGEGRARREIAEGVLGVNPD